MFALPLPHHQYSRPSYSFGHPHGGPRTIYVNAPCRNRNVWRRSALPEPQDKIAILRRRMGAVKNSYDQKMSNISDNLARNEAQMKHLEREKQHLLQAKQHVQEQYEAEEARIVQAVEEEVKRRESEIQKREEHEKAMKEKAAKEPKDDDAKTVFFRAPNGVVYKMVLASQQKATETKEDSKSTTPATESKDANKEVTTKEEKKEEEAKDTTNEAEPSKETESNKAPANEDTTKQNTNEKEAREENPFAAMHHLPSEVNELLSFFFGPVNGAAPTKPKCQQPSTAEKEKDEEPTKKEDAAAPMQVAPTIVDLLNVMLEPTPASEPAKENKATIETEVKSEPATTEKETKVETETVVEPSTEDANKDDSTKVESKKEDNPKNNEEQDKDGDTTGESVEVEEASDDEWEGLSHESGESATSSSASGKAGSDGGSSWMEPVETEAASDETK